MHLLLCARAMLRTCCGGLSLGFLSALAMFALSDVAVGQNGSQPQASQAVAAANQQELTETPTSSGQTKLPPAQVLIGAPLIWRELSRYQLGPMLCVRGNLDHDSDDEVLAIGDFRSLPFYAAAAGAKGASTVIELDGETTFVGIGSYTFCPGASAWDLDGDGVDEVVPFDSFSSYFRQASYYETKPEPPPIYGSLIDPDHSTPVLSLTGGVRAALPGGGVWDDNLVGDFDGDCRPELVLEDYSAPSGRPSLIYYSSGGREIGRSREVVIADCAPAFYSGCVADIDGDGCDEIVMPAYGTKVGLDRIDVHAVRYDMQTRVFSNTGLFGYLHARDINCDGRDEVISPIGLADLCGTTKVAFNYPLRPYTNTSRVPTCVAGDFDGDGVSEIAVLDGIDYTNCSLFVFDLSGRCKYYEELGDAAQFMFSAQAGGEDYLVLCFIGGRIISYP